MTLHHQSYTITATSPVDIDGIQFCEYRTLNVGRYVWIDAYGHMLVKKSTDSGKTWTAIRYSTISKQQIIVGKFYRSRDKAMRACIIAAFGAHRR